MIELITQNSEPFTVQELQQLDKDTLYLYTFDLKSANVDNTWVLMTNIVTSDDDDEGRELYTIAVSIDEVVSIDKECDIVFVTVKTE